MIGKFVSDFFRIMFLIFSEMNISLHEKEESRRTSIFTIFGETDEFADFELLLEKCVRAERKERPRTAIELRNEKVLVDFLNKLENGARPCELVPPPFENAKDARVRELKEELAQERKKSAELEKRLNFEANAKQEIGQRDQIIQRQNEVDKDKIVKFNILKIRKSRS